MDKKKFGEGQVHRLSGRLHRVDPIIDTAGQVIHYAISPMRVELRRRDLMQIIVGSSVLAVPIGFTQEAWDLGRTLPFINILALSLLSIIFVAAYVYFNFYRDFLHQYFVEYVTRVITVYLLSLVVVGLLLAIIQVAPWADDFFLALKRTVIVGFPASMSAAVSDAID